jgi:hypothetical protein
MAFDQTRIAKCALHEFNFDSSSQYRNNYYISEEGPSGSAASLGTRYI